MQRSYDFVDPYSALYLKLVGPTKIRKCDGWMSNVKRRREKVEYMQCSLRFQFCGVPTVTGAYDYVQAYAKVDIVIGANAGYESNRAS